MISNKTDHNLDDKLELESHDTVYETDDNHTWPLPANAENDVVWRCEWSVCGCVVWGGVGAVPWLRYKSSHHTPLFRGADYGKAETSAPTCNKKTSCEENNNCKWDGLT